ncbi:MAG: SPOR domain-containing protein, partial [Candidatus Cloacimonetes bacterium]|nr:SPOR domain-containing protein [Candidatus Cloacimonadota bacterium]
IQQNKFKRALNTLEFLRNSEFINNNIPLLHFKIGYCNEKIKKYEEALKSYQKLKIDFPYHQYSYSAEDRIFNLTRNEKFEIAPNDIQPNNNLNNNKVDQENKLKKFLQVGAFSTRKNAQKHALDINNFLNHSYIVFEKVINSKNLFIVAFGPYENDKSLNKAKQTLEKKGFNSFLIQKYR